MNKIKNIHCQKADKRMKKDCKISIIMPSLNVVDYIDECIESALNQTLFEKEIICIDAGSTDGTWERLLAYANNPEYKEQIKLLQSNIKSYGYQLNLALHFAVGEYIGILETDDYIRTDMYEQLYNIGVANNADYVKANYDTFVTYPDHTRIFDSITLFPNNKEMYGKVLNPGLNLHLYINDHNIWSGIYKRTFLLTHNILLNESKGAAFQDIGFIQQILASSKRAIYIEQSFYRYRMDREQSSINSVDGLKYSFWEFSRLWINTDLKEKIIYIDGFFVHMAQSFCCELIKSLRAAEYNSDSEFIKPYYIWFKEQILYAMQNHLLNINLYQLYPQLQSILDNIHEFSFKLKVDDLSLKSAKANLLYAVKDKKIILFGFGAGGKSIVKYLYGQNIRVQAVCDNNKSLWDTKEYGLFIYSPSKCVKKFPDHIYIITNKKYDKEISKQLLDLGIKQENIYIYS